MKKNLLVLLLPLAGAAVYWVADGFLNTILWPDYVVWPRRICAFAILLAGCFIARAYLRLSTASRESADAIRKLTQEKQRSQSAAEEQEKRATALSGEVEAMRQSLLRATENLDGLGTIVMILDPGGVVRFANRKACQVLGYGKDDIVGRMFFENFVPASVRDFVRNEAKKLTSGDPSAEKEYTGLLIDRNGSERVIAWHHAVLKDERGRVTAIISAGEDVTGRIEKETREVELRERQSRVKRMNSLALFAAGVARRLGDTLSGVRRPDVGTARDETGAEPAGREVADAFKEAEGLVSDLEAIAGTAGSGTTEVNLNDVVRTCLNSSGLFELREAHPSVSIEFDPAADLLTVSGSDQQLVKALFGLVARAVVAVPEGGGVLVSTRNLHVGEDLVKYETIPAGDYAVVRVADDGKEIDEASLERIFEPFGCPDHAKAGQLSLALAYGIVKAHKGYVNTRSEVGHGTEFALCFPVIRPDLEINDKVLAAPRGSESILVVDDTEQERTIARRLLNSLGYEVKVAASGQEALRLFRESKTGKSPFDLVLLDMVLGEDFDGLDTYREIAKLFPDQKCIIVSGYSESDRSKEALHLGASRFISKPLDLENLAKLVRDELDEKE